MFTINNAIHNYNTRQKNNLHIRNYHTKVREHRVSVCGVNTWNDIPEEFKELRTYNQFRLKCKSYFLSKTTLIRYSLVTNCSLLLTLYFIYFLYFPFFSFFFLLILYAGVYVTLRNGM